MIAGYYEKFTFIKGDITDDVTIEQLLGIEAIYADPEWALPGHRKGDHVTSIFQTNPPVDVLYKQLRQVTPNIAIRLPKETNVQELQDFPAYEIEAAYLDGKHKAYTAYFGDLIKIEGLTELRKGTS